MSAQDTARTANCQCGQLSLACTGDPVRISTCHCLDCQRRSGSSFAAQARFPTENVTITGEARHWTRFGDEGGQGDMYFCPTCGSNVFYRLPAEPELIAVAIGAFADPTFPPPQYSVYEDRKHAWVEIAGDGIDHYD